MNSRCRLNIPNAETEGLKCFELHIKTILEFEVLVFFCLLFQIFGLECPTSKIYISVDYFGLQIFVLGVLILCHVLRKNTLKPT